MDTRILMIASAAFLFVLGLAATFLPAELLQWSGSTDAELAVLIVQIGGAAYVGFALLNWTAREYLIGGIYAKPLSLANFAHFAAAAIALVKAALAGALVGPMLVGAAIYVLFAVAFGYVMFNHPRGGGGNDGGSGNGGGGA